jgi:hypothetical protein
MSLAGVLLVLRILSAVLLLAVVATLFLVMWRDYQSAAEEIEAARKVYGHLVGLRELEGSYVPTGEVFPLTPHTSIGRAPTNNIRLDDQFASSEHCVVSLKNGVWWLEDRASRNGTNLNGMEVEQPVIITDGDIINIGTKHYRIEIDSQT